MYISNVSLMSGNAIQITILECNKVIDVYATMVESYNSISRVLSTVQCFDSFIRWV